MYFMNKRLKDTNVSILSIHPGVVKTVSREISTNLVLVVLRQLPNATFAVVRIFFYVNQRFSFY